MRDELESAKVKNAALEPRVETLNAELAEARADAKVARAESEYLRAAGDEARDRGASSDAERAVAEKHLADLKDVTRDLERKASEAEGRALALRSALETAEKKTARLEEELEASNEKLRACDVETREVSSLRSRLEALRVTHEEQSAALASARSALSDAAADSAAVSSRAEGRGRASSLGGRCAALEAASLQKDAELRQSAIVRRALHNQVQELKGNIRVFCRVRPINESGGESADAAETGAGKDHSEPLLKIARARANPPGARSPVAPPEKKEKPTRFAFDRVFGGDAGQAEVFEDIAHLVQSALDGYKVCIFAYGQTGSGKTYTMLGDDRRENENAGAGAKGLIPRCVERASSRRATTVTTSRFDVTATMVEIYNEEIKDLLSDNTDETVKHDVKHDARTGETSVTHAASIEVTSAREIDSLVRRAIAARTTRATKMNDHSSRSHMVFTLNLTGVDASGAPRRGVLNLVDLAGSERLSRTGATGDRLKEAQSINKSLSALGDVIAARAEKAAHVPYRNSSSPTCSRTRSGGTPRR